MPRSVFIVASYLTPRLSRTSLMVATWTPRPTFMNWFSTTVLPSYSTVGWNPRGMCMVCTCMA